MSALADQPVTGLHGVGPRLAEKLARLGIHTAEDLLFHLPFRYEDRTHTTPIGALRPEQGAVVEGRILGADVVFGRRRSLLCRVSDNTGLLSLRFYHFSAQQKASLEAGRVIRCFGEVRAGATGLEMYHPEYQSAATTLPPLEASLTPVYPATEGVGQRKLRDLIDQALQQLAGSAVAELLPQGLVSTGHGPDLTAALTVVHRPRPDEDIQSLMAGTHPAVQRLVFEEMVSHHLGMLVKRAGQRAHQAPAFVGTGKLMQQLQDTLPFQLTGAQKRVIGEIHHDQEQPVPMLRLVQGDVGSGKTLVAAAAALQAIEAGWQVALMAPTEILAEQHLLNFSRWLEPLGIQVLWLTGSLKGARRTTALAQLESGEAQLVVGTHALFQEAVRFHRLGLVIIDEQHRFGVHQRLALREKGRQDNRVPHQLVLTATPIPRTLAMSLYGDLDTSIIDELPPGRQPIETLVLPDSRRDQVVARIHQACAEGTQAYWVCTLIEDSEALQAEAAEASLVALRDALPDLDIELVHGRLKSAEKAERMARFSRGEAQVLVATTVIEVGVDVPNATLMVIENAERLGLAQLHQLRGRVGRGSGKSFCVLMYKSPLSEVARRRLAVMRETGDGFRIAEEDLRIRGPGEWLGTRQTGELVFRVTDLLRDEALMEPARAVAQTLMTKYPARVEPLLKRWLKGGEDYAEV